MRFELVLIPLDKTVKLPFNYQYALSAVVYKKLGEADEEYANFLHQKGYTKNDHSKQFKLFSYSNLKGNFNADRTSLLLKDSKTGFILGCHTPEFAENLIKGVFSNQRISIGDHSAQSDFQVEQIIAIADLDFKSKENHTLKLLSPICVGKKNDRGNYDYLSPIDSDFLPILKNNLNDKLLTVYPDRIFEFEIGLSLFPTQLKSKLVTVKAGTPEETKVKGFIGFTININAEADVINMALCAGLGQYNGVGFGCVGKI